MLRSISLVKIAPFVSTPERQRRDVEEQNVLDLALQHAGLDRCADRNDLVRVHALVRVLATGQLLDEVAHLRHTGRATDEDHVVDLVDTRSPRP